MKMILLVDDDENIRRVLRLLVARTSPEAKIVDAGNGRDALALIKASGISFDLVITDKDMPRMDGVELAEKVREDYPETIIVLSSGKPEPEGHKAHVFVQKPFGIEDVRTILEEFLGE